MKKQNHSGFTLVEIMVSLGIMGIIILMLSSLFLINIRIFQKTDDSAELQYQGQFAMNFIGDKIMEANAIEKIFNEQSIDITDQISIDKTRVSKMVLTKADSKDKNKVDIFEIKYSKLFYGLADLPHKPATTEVASYIKEVWVQPFPKDKKFANAKTLQVIIRLAKNKKNTEIISTFYLRNYKVKDSNY